jgi:hypothetical protein
MLTYLLNAQMLTGELKATHGNIQINPKVRIARYTQVRIINVSRHTSHVTRHTSHVTPPPRPTAPRRGSASRPYPAGGNAVELSKQSLQITSPSSLFSSSPPPPPPSPHPPQLSLSFETLNLYFISYWPGPPRIASFFSAFRCYREFKHTGPPLISHSSVTCDV